LTIHSEERTNALLSGFDTYKEIGSWEKCKDNDKVLKGIILFNYPRW